MGLPMTSIAIDRLDGLSSSVAVKGPCGVATTANITLSGTQTIDGLTVAVDDRVLVKDQSTASENGIYIVDTGAWRRAKDFSRTADVKTGTRVYINSGTVNAEREYAVSTTGTISIGTSSIAFTQTPTLTGLGGSTAGVQSFKYDFNTVALLLADTVRTYSNTAAGDYIRTRSEGFSYLVAASGATDHHVTTGGGLKLYAMPLSIGHDIRAWGGTSANINTALANWVSYLGSDTGVVTRGDMHLPAGDYTLGATITSITQSLGLIGHGSPIIRASGLTGASLFKFQDYSTTTVENVIFLGQSGSVPAAAINSERVVPSGGEIGTNELLRVKNVKIGRRWIQDSGNSTGFVYGIYVGGTEGNNDQFTIDGCAIHDCSTAGLNIANTQSIWSSSRDTLFDTCGFGVITNSNLELINPQFNRNVSGDVKVLNNARLKVTQFNAENSVLLADLSLGASIFIDGGKAILNETYMTGDYWLDANAAQNVNISNFMTQYSGATTQKKLRITAGSASTSKLVLKGNSLGQPAGTGAGPGDGETRSAYELRAPASTGGVVFDISQGSFNVKGRLDGTVTVDPPSLATNADSVTSFAVGSVTGISSGDPVLVSFSNTTQSIVLQGNAYGTNLLFGRFWNKTGGTIDLASGLMRWRKISNNEIKAKETATYDAPSVAAGAGTTTTISAGGNVGDFVYWGAALDTRSMSINAYFSAANVVTLNFTNLSSGAVNLASADYTAYVIRDDAFDFIGAKVVDVASLAAGAQTTFTVSVPGAEVGDFPIMAASVSLAGLYHNVTISASGTATIVLFNPTVGAIDLASAYFRVGVFIALG